MTDSIFEPLKSIWLYLGIVWPFFVAWLGLKVFPSSLIKIIENAIDRRSDEKLEKLKAELNATYSTLKSSVEAISISNSAMRPHIVESIEVLWHEIIRLREKSGNLLVFDSVTTLEEKREAFGKDMHKNFLEFVRPLENDVDAHNFNLEADSGAFDKCRLFCTGRVWLVFYTYRAVIGRNALLLSWSFRDHGYRDWREDKVMRDLLVNVLEDVDLKTLMEANLGGLSEILSRLESEFLQEATRVMSGSQAMEEGLPSMQTLLAIENTTLNQRNLGK